MALASESAIATPNMNFSISMQLDTVIFLFPGMFLGVDNCTNIHIYTAYIVRDKNEIDNVKKIYARPKIKIDCTMFVSSVSVILSE